MKRTVVLAALLTAGFLTAAVAGMIQAPGAQAPRVVQTDKLKDNLFVLKGGGGNSSVFITGTGVVVVDTKNPGWGQPLLEAIKKITDKPVTMIINTHTHGDHVSGNVEFPATVDIVTQENTAANMAIPIKFAIELLNKAGWQQPEATPLQNANNQANVASTGSQQNKNP